VEQSVPLGHRLADRRQLFRPQRRDREQLRLTLAPAVTAQRVERALAEAVEQGARELLAHALDHLVLEQTRNLLLAP
jgi:hypothetical protein